MLVLFTDYSVVHAKKCNILQPYIFNKSTSLAFKIVSIFLIKLSVLFCKSSCASTESKIER